LNTACLLQDRPVRTVSGRRLGHVHDVRCEHRGTRTAVTHLVYGRRGLLERLGFRVVRREAIPWKQVIEVREDSVIVAD
jgi:sporulation protein YlmC with PRC-barrel domain